MSPTELPAAPEPSDATEPAPEKQAPASPPAAEIVTPKPKSSGRTNRSKSASRGSMVPPVLRSLTVAVCVAAVAIGGFVGLQRARNFVMKEDRFQMAFRDVQVPVPPDWVRGDLVGEVQKIAGLPDTLNTLDETLSRQLHDAFAMHPWVAEVTEVRVTRPSTIRISLKYREPVAAVHTTRSLESVDRDGVLLPAARLPDSESLLTITGIRSTPTGPAGTRWDDPTLAAGISVATALTPAFRTLGITTVDVGSYRPTASNPGSIFLLTEQGTRIKWGKPPTANYPGEVPTQDKIDRLTKYASENGSLDKPTGPYEIDITHWQEISLRPRNQPATKNR